MSIVMRTTMHRLIVRCFLVSAGGAFILSGVLKLSWVLSQDRDVLRRDALLGIVEYDLYMFAGILEVVGSVSVAFLKSSVGAFMLTWMGFAVFTYRVLSGFNGSGIWCRCFGAVPDWLGLSTFWTSVGAWAMLVYVCTGGLLCMRILQGRP